MTAGASGTYASGNKKILPHIATRLQNSITAYDKYIFVVGFNYFTGTSKGIYYMDVETEKWWVASVTGFSGKGKLYLIIKLIVTYI